MKKWRIVAHRALAEPRFDTAEEATAYLNEHSGHEHLPGTWIEQVDVDEEDA